MQITGLPGVIITHVKRLATRTAGIICRGKFAFLNASSIIGYNAKQSASPLIPPYASTAPAMIMAGIISFAPSLSMMTEDIALAAPVISITFDKIQPISKRIQFA